MAFSYNRLSAALCFGVDFLELEPKLPRPFVEDEDERLRLAHEEVRLGVERLEELVRLDD